MDTASAVDARRLLARWVFATFWGWLLGFVFMMAGAITADLAMGAERAQFFIGLGMGAGIGYAQARVTSQFLGIGDRWGWLTVAGMGAPFIMADLLRIAGIGLPFFPSIWLCASCGGLLVGLLQHPLLRRHGSRARWWVAASLAGWLLAGATPLLYGTLLGIGPGAVAAVINIGAILLGGAVLGVVTGATLVWVLPAEPHAA